MSDLTQEAEQILKYLVLNATPQDLVPLNKIELSTNLQGTNLTDAIAELEESSLLDTQPGHVRPRARAWEVAGEDVVGFDVRLDASKVAPTVADAPDWVEAQQLEQATGLPIERLNIAALWLRDKGVVTLRQAFGTRPYAFASARATYQTRKWPRTAEGHLWKNLLRKNLYEATHGVDFTYVVQSRDWSVPSSVDPVPPAEQPSQQVFISYRRDDSAGHAGRLRDNLVHRYGTDKVFMDLDIEPGVDFIDTIKEAVGSCAVLLAVIGRQWLTMADSNTGMRRLDNPEDFVRIEIATALQRKIRVIPILVHRAQMPNANALPDDLKPLARRQAHEITDSRWDYDVGNLVAVLDKNVGFEE